MSQVGSFPLGLVLGLAYRRNVESPWVSFGVDESRPVEFQWPYWLLLFEDFPVWALPKPPWGLFLMRRQYTETLMARLAGIAIPGRPTLGSFGIANGFV